MPLFISEEEFRRCSGDAGLVAEKADVFIRELYSQIETVKAEADAASITFEQTCSIIEQKYVSLSAEHSSLQSQHSELNSSLEQRTSELGQLQSEKQQLLLQSIEKDGEIERLKREASELHKSKRQLMELLEQKDLEVSEKNATIKSYLDKIVNLTENAASKEARVADLESELGRLQAISARALQEKELLERHNTWLNEELTAKVDSLIQLRKAHGELEADMTSKLADVENKFKESSSSLKLHKDRARELEEKLASTERELLSTKDAATATEERFSAEIATVSKLVDLYKESSEEWSKKATELEGVIKALETHLNQVESDYKDRLEKEESARKEVEKVILQSETIQELTKTSQALASAQEETTELRKVVDALKTENIDLKSKWETEKLAIEAYKNEADKKYSEVNELNKILHSRLEALHIRLAEKERGIASGSSSQSFADDDGLQNVVNYLRRTKEIAETEISLLKQEKLRLQSQLEVALKSAENAQTSLNTERAKARASLFTDDEFKSLQLQVRELTLLRESNVQLREENRHNFEECQKLRETLQNVRIETENLEKLLRDRDTELEGSRKEIEILKMEKVHLEKRIDELVEKCNNVDLDDYNRLKESFQQIQGNLRERDSQLEETKKLLSEKQDAISLLERDFARSRTELNERETRINEILQAEASLKSEAEKMRRLSLQARRKSEHLMKEKEEMSKEMQVLSKQLEEARQVKRNTVDPAGEQALREKEKEKDTRIQILEKTLERHREDLKKEKEDHHKEKEKSQKIRKTIIESREIVTQQKTKLSDELKKHKEALRVLQDEVEKLKNSGGSQMESTSVGQDFSSTLLDDFASAYYQAVENFEQVAQPACGELDSATTDTPLDNTSSAGAPVGQAVTSLTQTPAVLAANIPPTRANEEKERRLALAKANIKMGRKLVRPNITKPKEPQGDVEMSEADESNIGLSSQNTESQGNVTDAPTASARKRPSASVSSDLQDEMLAPEETSSDTPAPLLKKSKASESPQEGGEEPSAAPVKLSEVVLIEELSGDAGNVQQGINKEEHADAEKEEFETAGEQVEEPTTDDQTQAELLSDTGEVAEEKLDKPSETLVSDDQLRDQTEQDIQQIVTESGGEREEGELAADFADNDGDSNVFNEMGATEIGEFQPEQSVERENSPITEPLASASLEAGEIDPSETPEEEKNADMTENMLDGSNKLNDSADAIAETSQVPGSSVATTTDEVSVSTSVDVARSSEHGGPAPTSSEPGGLAPTPDAKPVSPLNSSTTINLQERARQRAHLRQAGLITSSPSRARGRAIRGRGARGGRTPRGQSPS
ncbi:UNVERIFIED_CONTAM: Nuclear-pore anchor [Sesamum angustifolium]|uniref:Nuclear-pore anchor n=1 Tax=Sesamum angustifolium TaxID=2727405 RepID=A0AAW2KW36_9LAMI